MRCNHCGTELAEDSLFCTFCGTQQSPSAGSDYPSDFSSSYIDPSIATANAASVTPKKKKRPIGKIVLGSIAAVLVVVIVAGLCTNWFGYYGPFTRIGLAAKNTLKTGNFTIEASNDNGTEALMQIDIDYKNRTLTYFQESERTSDYNGEKYTYYTAIYEGYSISGFIYDNGEVFLYKHDISDQLEDFFDDYEDAGDMDWDDLFEFLDDATDEDLDDYLNEDQFEKCAKSYFRKLNNNKWLKENAGYSKTKKNGVTYFNFEPKPYTFLRSSLECFETAFEDDDDYDDAMDSLKDNRHDLNDYEFEISIGIKGNKLAEIVFENDEDEITMEFVDIDNTYIDENFVKYLYDTAKDEDY